MGRFETNRLREPLRKRSRITLHARHAKRRSTFRIPGVVHSDRRMLLYSNAGHIGFLAGRHPLAPLLSSMDVRCHDRVELSAEPVGIFHRNLCGGLVGLHKHFRNYFPFQRPPATLLVDSQCSQWTSGASGFDHRGSGMVRESGCHYWLCLGVFSIAHKILG